MQAWEEFLVAQEKELGAATIKKWLRPLRVMRFDACNLYLEAKDSFQVHWFEEHIRPIILTKLVSKSNKRIKVHLNVASSKKENIPSIKEKKEGLNSLPVFQLQFDPVDPTISTKQFLVSAENKVTTLLLSELEEGKLPPASFNPIYLHGPSGCGKTHLLQGLTNYFKQKGIKALYVRAETFTEHVVSAIRSSNMQKFRQAYRNAEMLLIDDIEIFSKKGATQEELFHTFNTLHLEGKQIIISSKCTPGELQEIEPRLVSRFEWGIVLPIAPLKDDLLRVLLLQRAKSFEIVLDSKVVDLLLNTFKTGTKSLLKALDALVLRIHLRKSNGKPLQLPLSIEDYKELLFDLIKAEEESVLTWSKIVRIVAEFHGITVDDILGKAQSRECSVPRKIAMFLCRQELQIPFMKIGELFKRDHSTVMTSVKQIEEDKNKKAEFASTIHTILKQLSRSPHDH